MKAPASTAFPCLVLALSALSAGPAHAEEFAMVGASTASCAKYNADRSNQAYANAYVDGAQGFLSGFNMSSHLIGKLPFKKMPDTAALQSGMVSYCSAHADQALARGLMLMWKDLPEMARLPR